MSRSGGRLGRWSWLSLGLLFAAAGCGGGGMSLIAISPTAVQVLDSGQSITITASVVNDSSNQGATFTVTGGGTLSNQTKIPSGDSNFVSVTYTAPSVTATTPVTVTATSGNTPSQSATVKITVNPALTISATTLPNGTVGTAYAATLGSTGGSAPLKWALVSGSLPTGVGLNPATGSLSGTPSAYGTFAFALSVTDTSAAPPTVTQAYTVTIAPMTPTVTTLTLPNGVAGSGYSQQLTYTGGNTSAPAWTLVSGALPGGLTMSASGLITGTPTNASAGATYSFSVSVAVGTQTSPVVPLQIVVPALPAVTTTALPSGNVTVPYSEQLTYSGGAGGTVTWAITSGSLPASSGLTLSASGLISGTPTLQTTYTFSVAVTVGTQTSASQPLTLVINNVIVTSAANASGEIGLPFSFNLTARGGTLPYTWSLASGSAALPGLSLNTTTGAITGSPTSASGSPFGNIVVEATDAVSEVATLTMTFTISAARSGANNSELNGQYAFLLSGFDSKGNPLAVAGKFIADGNGNITGGVMDTNGTGLTAPLANSTLTATTYAVGPDNRGKLTLTTGSGSSTYVIALNSISGGVAGGGYMTEFDASGQSLTGVLALQTPGAFNTPAIANGFAFGMDGFAAGSTAAHLTHRGAAGEVQFSGAGGITSAELLSTGTGSTTPIVPTGSSSDSIAANGRGTMQLTLPGGSTMNFVMYVVSGGKMFLMTSDPAGSTGSKDLLYGEALQQTTASGSFSVASLSGVSVVRTERLAVTTAGAPYPDAQVGLYTFSGGKVSLASDENAGGTISSNALSGSYTVAGNGRVTLNLSSGLGGCTDCVSAETYFYLVGSGQGFVLDFSSPVNSGYFEPQTATGFSATSFNGTYASGTLDPLSQSGAFTSEVLNSTGAGAVTGTEDQNAAGTLAADVPLTANYAVGSTGRVALAPAGGGGSVLYIISASKALLINLSSSSPVIQELLH